MNEIRVLVIDDSPTARFLIKETLESDPSIKVIAMAEDPYEARDIVVRDNPDVICLDVEMPKMDGITFLKKLMKHFPRPVVMVSSLTHKGTSTTIEALEIGAIDFVGKPDANLDGGIDGIEAELVTKVKLAARSNIKYKMPQINHLTAIPKSKFANKIIAIGASTGGTNAIKEVLQALPKDFPPVVIVQHMPPDYTKAFADRLNDICEVDVKEASDGDRVCDGQVLIAPGGYHMVIRHDSSGYSVKVGSGEKVSGHRPSVDVLMFSVAKYAKNNAIGVILTGMGGDGAKGMKQLRDSGAKTIGQDEASCVVYGMPKVAFELGGVEHVVPLEKVPDKLLSLLN
jgi:two-component system chemotaxis response regulator CheB